MTPKILIHIGYPKTATTTLQNGLFINLHFNNEINYLGMDRHSRIKQFEEYKYLRSFLYHNNKFSTRNLSLSQNKLNVLSDEVLTFPTFYRKQQRTSDVGESLNFPNKLFSILKNYEVSILVTLRNQADLMHSLYSQKYSSIFIDKAEHCTPSKHFFDKNKSLKKYVFDIYDFNQMLNSYAGFFGKENIHVGLFEDFIHNREKFFYNLSQALNKSKSKIEDNFSGKHLRKKKKENGYKYEKKHVERLPMLFYKKFILTGKNKYIRYINNRIDSLGLFSKKNKMLYKEEIIKVPDLVAKDKEIIFNHFKGSNIELVNDFNLSRNDLKKYGYI